MLLAAGRPNIVVGSPPEFKGEPGIWAPEELLVGFAQYVHDADIPHARSIPRPDPDRI
jgi:hypothetical protein